MTSDEWLATTYVNLWAINYQYLCRPILGRSITFHILPPSFGLFRFWNFFFSNSFICLHWSAGWPGTSKMTKHTKFFIHTFNSIHAQFGSMEPHRWFIVSLSACMPIAVRVSCLVPFFCEWIQGWRHSADMFQDDYVIKVICAYERIPMNGQQQALKWKRLEKNVIH